MVETNGKKTGGVKKTKKAPGSFWKTCVKNTQKVDMLVCQFFKRILCMCVFVCVCVSHPWKISLLGKNSPLVTAFWPWQPLQLGAKPPRMATPMWDHRNSLMVACVLKALLVPLMSSTELESLSFFWWKNSGGWWLGVDFDDWEDGELEFAGCLHQEGSEHPPAETGLAGPNFPGHDVGPHVEVSCSLMFAGGRYYSHEAEADEGFLDAQVLFSESCLFRKKKTRAKTTKLPGASFMDTDPSLFPLVK